MMRLTIAVLLSACTVAAQEYGVDNSFPMHHEHIVEGEANPLGAQSRLDFYKDFMDGCVKYYGRDGHRCLSSEQERIEMTLQQPKDMQNFTNAGFAKIQAPEGVTKILREFWDAHKGDAAEEAWPKGNIYVNHWNKPTSILPLGDEEQSAVVELVRPVLEAWTGKKLILTSLYGIRVYKEGAVLSPHVDRLPLVSSCILNVAQDVDEDWPIEVIGHDGKATNVTAHPGDMILYESHSVIHGRPFALKGRYYANIFVHFEPFGYTLQHVEKGSYGARLDEEELEELENVYKAEEDEVDEEVQEDYDTPDYVHKDKDSAWRQAYAYDPDTKTPKDDEEKTTTHMQEVRKLTPHSAAAMGRLDVLQELVKADPSNLTKQDVNGWRPIHEAARSGEIEVLKFLVEHGADVNERTNEGSGGTPLFWAEQMLPKESEAVLFLKAKGAKNIPPMPNGKPNDGEL